MKIYIFLLVFVCMLSSKQVLSQNAFIIAQIEFTESSFSNFNSIGWETGINVKVFNQEFDRRAKAPSNQEFIDVDGVIYFVNYPLGSQAFTPNMATLTMETLHRIYRFVENGGNAIIFMNNEPALRRKELVNYIRDTFELFPNSAWTWHGTAGSTVTTFPFDGSLIHETLRGLTIGGCFGNATNIQAWYNPRPNYWNGEPIGDFTPDRYISVERKIGNGNLIFTIDCRNDSIFSNKFIESFDHFEAAKRLLKLIVGL